MKNKIISLFILLTSAVILASCGTIRNANAANSTGKPQDQPTTPTATVDPIDAVIATLGDWQTLQTGGNISLKAGSNFSSSIQVRMVRDQAIFISLRPMLGIEVGRLLITADSLYAVDKVHKRYIAEKVSLLTAGIPVTVSDVQDIFLGRPFLIGKGTLDEALKPQVTCENKGNAIVLSSNENYKGYSYAFSYDKSSETMRLDLS